MGHVNQRPQNIRSTSKAPIEDQPTQDTDLGSKTLFVYAVVVDQGQLYTDLTGKFPVRSSKGNSYVMVCYVYDCNYVKVIPMKISVRLRMGQSIWYHLSRTHCQGLQTKTPNSRQRGIINWCRLTVIAATPRNAPSRLSKNNLRRGSLQ
jgi:hypothetical protein